MKRFAYTIPALVLLALAVVFYFALTKKSQDELPSTLINREMPALPDLALDSYEAGQLNDLIANNKIVLVNFFASWCAPCRAEHPQLVFLQEKGIPIIGVNYKDDPKNAKRFIEENGNPYIAIRADESGRAGIDWGLSGVPETFFIDQQGIVVKRYFGPITEDALTNEVLPFIDAL